MSPLSQLLLPALLSAALANYSELGQCPQTPRQRRPALARLTGTWHEQMRYSDPGFRGRCVRLEVVPQPGGAVLLNETRLESPDDTRYETADLALPPGDGSAPLLRSSRWAWQYLLVASDYTGHAVLQKCKQYPDFHARTVLVLTRQREADQDMLERMVERLGRQGLRTDRLVPTPQTDCPEV